MAQFTICRVSEASATELGTQNAPGKAPVRAQRRIIKYIGSHYSANDSPIFRRTLELRSLLDTSRQPHYKSPFFFLQINYVENVSAKKMN